MDYNNQDFNNQAFNNGDGQNFRPIHRENPLAKAALVLAIISICTFYFILISLPCGILAIILALLSRRKDGLIPKKGKHALICAIIGVGATIMITSYSFFATIEAFGGFDNFMEYYTEFAEDYMESYGYEISEV